MSPKVLFEQVCGLYIARGCHLKVLIIDTVCLYFYIHYFPAGGDEVSCSNGMNIMAIF